MADERLLAFLRELERADEDVAATLEELDALAADVEAVRLRALELSARLARLPAERDRLDGARRQAEDTASSRRGELESARRRETSAREAGDERGTAAAQHDVVRAADSLRMAERSAASALAKLARLDDEADAASREVSELGARGRRMAQTLSERPRLAGEVADPPGKGPAETAEWASAARAALFVARASLSAERDAVIRQANELAALVLGEPVAAGSTADVAHRIRQHR